MTAAAKPTTLHIHTVATPIGWTVELNGGGGEGEGGEERAEPAASGRQPLHDILVLIVLINCVRVW